MKLNWVGSLIVVVVGVLAGIAIVALQPKQVMPDQTIQVTYRPVPCTASTPQGCSASSSIPPDSLKDQGTPNFHTPEDERYVRQHTEKSNQAEWDYGKWQRDTSERITLDLARDPRIILGIKPNGDGTFRVVLAPEVVQGIVLRELENR